MIFGRSRKLCSIGVVVLIVAWAMCPKCVFALVNAELSSSSSPALLPSIVTTDFVLNQDQPSEIIAAELLTASKEFLSPPESNFQIAQNSSVTVKVLPAIPATLYMALCGFLCVFVVRDRRMLVTAFATFLWAGQVGITAIPRLVCHLTGRENRHSSQTLYLKSYLENSFNFLSNNKEIRYVGLLHHLAGIPKNHKVSAIRFTIRGTRYSVNKFTLRSLQGVLFSQPIGAQLNCLVKQARQILYFQPICNFCQLARSPPTRS